MSIKHAFYAQSGGVTAVINASACGVIETARQHSDKMGTVYAGRNGIIGALREELIDTGLESDAAIAALKHTPGGAFGSCRYKLKDINSHRTQYERLIDVFKAHDIGYFFYNGGGDSQDTTHKVSQMSQAMGYPLQCIGIPKTVDNDLYHTDNCPGFGSVAKYVATSIKEAALDVASMAESSTKVFIMEVMGRHAGWIAAASCLANDTPNSAPHIILLPEIAFDEAKFLAKVDSVVKQCGFCVICVSEGVRNTDDEFLADNGLRDAFGHAQLGGVAPYIASLIKAKLGLKYHWAVADYLQRSARHIASQVDVEQAYALGRTAVEFALAGKDAIMACIERSHNDAGNYQWHIGEAPLSDVANREKMLPREFISDDGMHVTAACRAYLLPLIQGEAYPPYKQGVPDYISLNNQLIAAKLIPFTL